MGQARLRAGVSARLRASSSGEEAAMLCVELGTPRRGRHLRQPGFQRWQGQAETPPLARLLPVRSGLATAEALRPGGCLPPRGCPLGHPGTWPRDSTAAGHHGMGRLGLRASSAQAPCPGSPGLVEQPEFSNKKAFPQEIPKHLSRGGGGEWGAKEEEGDVTSATGFAPHWPGPGPAGSRTPSPARAGSDAGPPRLIPALQGPHGVYSVEGCSSSPPASHTPPGTAAGSRGRRSCQVPLPAAARAWAGAGKFSTGRRAPTGSLRVADAGRETLIILKIPKSRYPKGAWGGGEDWLLAPASVSPHQSLWAQTKRSPVAPAKPLVATSQLLTSAPWGHRLTWEGERLPRETRTAANSLEGTARGT